MTTDVQREKKWQIECKQMANTQWHTSGPWLLSTFYLNRTSDPIPQTLTITLQWCPHISMIFQIKRCLFLFLLRHPFKYVNSCSLTYIFFIQQMHILVFMFIFSVWYQLITYFLPLLNLSLPHPSLSLSLPIHDDVIKWKHFPRCWPFVSGIHRSPVNSPHKGQWRGALIFLWSEQTAEQTIETLVIWDAIALIMTSF